MMIVLSPSKTLDFETSLSLDAFTTPEFMAEAETLAAVLKQLSPADLSQLMHISDKLAELNHLRYQNWRPPFTLENARQAVLAFKGDVYDGLHAEELTTDELVAAQGCLRILSGLYGLLKPLDLIQPYRLEMGCRLATARGKNLYEFWENRITDALNAALLEGPLVNLASAEYFKAVQPKKLKATVVTPVFKDFKNGAYKVIAFYAKVARGMMARFVIKNRIGSVDALKEFSQDGYRFDPDRSTEQNLVFRRKFAAS